MEVLNRVVEQYLRAFVHQRPGQWGKFLSWVEWSHNSSWNAGTGSTPFEITFGRKSFTFPEYIVGSSKLDVVDSSLVERDVVIQAIRKKLLKAQERMKRYADKKRKEVTFNCGEWVLVKLRPHRQTSAKGAQHTSDKLSKHFYGPFQILERISPVAYRLQLPEGIRIHPVFHVSSLKLFKGPPDMEAIELPDNFEGDQPLIFPIAILNSCRKDSTPNAPWEVLVQWRGLSPDETSWEDWSQLCQEFHLEDKVTLQGPRDDTEAGVEKEEETAIENQEANMEAGVSIAGTIADQPKGTKRKITKPNYLGDYV